VADTDWRWYVFSQLADCDTDPGDDDYATNVKIEFHVNRARETDGYLGFSAGLPQDEADQMAIAMIQINPQWTHGRDEFIQIGKPRPFEDRIGVDVGGHFYTPDEAEALGLALIRAAGAARGKF